MMNPSRSFTFALVTLFCLTFQASWHTAWSRPPQAKPDLVVVVCFDQYTHEYLTRFRPHFKEGLAMLLDRGAVFANTTYKHAQCTTGPGHAVLLSGASGAVNGIVSNTWYDRTIGANMYCVRDDSVRIVGAGRGEGRSPRWYAGSSLGDMLRLHTGFHSMVVSISNKDRAAILMGGRMPDGAYWMQDSAFVTSTYYRTDLPGWLQEFNRSGMINSFFGKSWKKSLPASAFAQMDRDDAPYEEDRDGLGRTFPHPISGKDHSRITSSYYPALWTSPYGAEIVAEAARRAVLGERLGKRGVTDLLCVSFSSTDYVGHAYGPHSHETLEMAVAMDRILGSFFAFLDRTIGLQRCLIAFSSDHGVSPIPEFIKAHAPGTAAGRFPGGAPGRAAEAAMVRAFGPPPSGSWVEAVVDHNVYLRLPLLKSRDLDPALAASVVADTIARLPGIGGAWNLLRLPADDGTGIPARARRSYRTDRSGEVYYTLKSNYLEGEGDGHGTSHGDPYDYNAHVPLIFMGPGIRPGYYTTDASPTDLAPTLAAILGVEFPSGREGKVLTEALTTEVRTR